MFLHFIDTPIPTLGMTNTEPSKHKTITYNCTKTHSKPYTEQNHYIYNCT